MIKKTINYVDYNGVEQTEDVYFNLTKAELTELELTKEGGLAKQIERIQEAKNNKELIMLFKEILMLSVGRKSEDGRRFVKNDEIREDFTSSEAYSTIFMELATNEDAAIDFMLGVMPAGLVTKEEVLNKVKNA